jgi:hypothetical protein
MCCLKTASQHLQAAFQRSVAIAIGSKYDSRHGQETRGREIGNSFLHDVLQVDE